MQTTGTEFVDGIESRQVSEGSVNKYEEPLEFELPSKAKVLD